MSDESYISFYEDEVRNVELTILDEKDIPYYPDHVFSYVEDSEGTVVVEDATRSVSANKVYMTIDTTVTSTPGVYNIIWTIHKNELEFKHKTALTVRPL